MIRKKDIDQGPIVVDLDGPQGNAFYLLGMAQTLSKQLGLDTAKILKEMQSKDYEHLLEVFDKYFGEFVILERS